MIILSKQPEVLEPPFSELEDVITPSEKFYVRDHFSRPEIDIESWRLSIEGRIKKRLALGYEEIRALPTTSITATLECAGNSRTFLVPPAKGVKWELGGIGTAVWEGVRLSHVLDQAGLAEESSEVIFRGSDMGEPEPDGKPMPAGAIHFERSVPLSKAMSDVLLAYKMNGQELSAKHGYPLRVIVPGWYAVASVKWLSNIIVSDEPFTGFYQSVDYAYWMERHGQPVRTPITKLQVKAAIARPRQDEVVRRNAAYEVFGAAWSGESEIERVDLSTDGGVTWNPATLLNESQINTWRLWSFRWQTPDAPGTTTLLARATDTNGNTQPMQHDRNHADYMIHFCLPIKVQIQ